MPLGSVTFHLEGNGEFTGQFGNLELKLYVNYHHCLCNYYYLTEHNLINKFLRTVGGKELTDSASELVMSVLYFKNSCLNSLFLI